MTIATQKHAEQALAHAQRAVEHYEKLIAGDGITCADLVVFGAELARALRRKAAAQKQIADTRQMEGTG